MSSDRAGDHASALATLQDALNVANGITDKPSKTNSLQRVASDYASLSEHSRAKEVIGQALAVAGQIKSVSSRSFAVFEIAFVLNQLGDADGLHRAIGLMKMDDSSIPYVLSELVHVEAGQGDIDAALQTIETLQNMQKIVRASAGAQWIAAARVQRDGIPAALAWARGQSSPYDRARALLGVAEGMVNKSGT
jgi:hypothetical protein